MGNKGCHLGYRLQLEEQVLEQLPCNQNQCWARALLSRPRLVHFECWYCFAASQATEHFVRRRNSWGWLCLSQWLALPFLPVIIWPPVYYVLCWVRSHISCVSGQSWPVSIPQFCDIPLFLTSLENSLADILSPDVIQSLSTTKEIDDLIVFLNSVIKSSALKSKLAFHSSCIPAKIPWWSANLWALRSKLKASYKLKRLDP